MLNQKNMVKLVAALFFVGSSALAYASQDVPGTPDVIGSHEAPEAQEVPHAPEAPEALEVEDVAEAAEAAHHGVEAPEVHHVEAPEVHHPEAPEAPDTRNHH